MLNENTDVILFPPFIYLSHFSSIKQRAHIFLGAQNCHYENNGAYTGEISASMLHAAGVKYCLVGHSERRKYFGETDETCLKKVKKLIENNVHPILCVGEELSDRDCENHFKCVEDQLVNVISKLTVDELTQLVIAYEPVWAIGTGRTATAAQAQEMHGFIRSAMQKQHGNIAQNISILYGGSCNEKNAAELFAQPDVDGGLIGGASLQVESFVKIIEAI